MIEGEVSDRLQAVIELKLRTPRSGVVVVPAIVDTGFNGFLTLPSSQIWRYGLIEIGSYRVELGDGSIINSTVYDAILLWRDAERLIPIESADGPSIVGMRLLEGFDLWMQIRGGGRVLIRPSIAGV